MEIKAEKSLTKIDEAQIINSLKNSLEKDRIINKLWRIVS